MSAELAVVEVEDAPRPAPGFGHYRTLPLHDLHSDGTYQRPVSPWRVRSIVFNYQPVLFQPLIIGQRGKKFYIIDGQHRAAAAKLLGFIMVPCMVYETKSAAEEARVFLWLNDKRRILSAPQKFRARIAFNEKKAKAVADLLAQFKFEITDYDKFNLSMPKDNEIVAIGSLEYLWDVDPKYCHDVLYVLRNAWDGRQSALNKRMIRGIGRFMALGNQYTAKGLSSKLSALSPFDLLYSADSVAHRDNLTQTEAMANIIANINADKPARQKASRT